MLDHQSNKVKSTSGYVLSTSGYVFTLGERVVAWKSSKQTSIACSTMQSKFIALDKANEKVEWLQKILKDISFWPKLVGPICIHRDSKAAIGRAKSIMYNEKSHHIRRRHNTMRQVLSSEIIIINDVKYRDNM